MSETVPERLSAPDRDDGCGPAAGLGSDGGPDAGPYSTVPWEILEAAGGISLLAVLPGLLATENGTATPIGRVAHSFVYPPTR